MIRNLLLTAAGLALAVGGFGQLLRAEDCCDAGCTTCKQPACIPTIETKKVAKKCFDMQCGTVCYPKCRKPLCSSHTCCNDCDQCDAKCSHGWKTHDLIVKTKFHDECVVKCTSCDTCTTCKKHSLFHKKDCSDGCCGSATTAEMAAPAPKAPEPIAAPMPK